MENIIYWTPAFGAAALVFAWYKAGWVSRQDAGTDRMKEIAGFIQSGAMAFLRREYGVLAVFALAVSVLLVASNYSAGTALVGLSFLVGAASSALAGFFGMKVATEANVRTTVVFRAHTGMPAVLRNVGIARARGKYVAFLDSDDRWAADKLGRQLALMAATPERRWSYTAVRRIDATGREIRERHVPWVPYEGSIVEQVLRVDAQIATPAVMAETAFVRELGGFDDDQAAHAAPAFARGSSAPGIGEKALRPAATFSYASAFRSAWCICIDSSSTMSWRALSSAGVEPALARAAVTKGSNAITFILRPSARFATILPMLPRPITPSVLP